MAYKVVRHAKTGKRVLEYLAPRRRRNIGPKGADNRRIILRYGVPYHVTKGWRQPCSFMPLGVGGAGAAPVFVRRFA